jgi:hypothetical protein
MQSANILTLVDFSVIARERSDRSNLKQKEIASPSPLPKGVRGLSVARNDREVETLIYQSQNIKGGKINV